MSPIRLSALGSLLVLGLGVAAPLVASAEVPGESPEPPPASAIPQGDSAEDEDFYRDDFGSDVESRDPWEPANRLFFGVNDILDTVLFDPITQGYQFVVPEFGRRCVRRLFSNLNSTSVIVNELFQLRFQDAAVTTGRLILNTSLGWGGLFDAAVEAGLEEKHADFGQTLAKVGVASGPYLVLPLFGPSTIRDGFGDLVDRGLQPLTYVLGPTPQLVLGAGEGLSLREEHAEALDALEKSAVDFYAVLRSAYFQSREAELGLPADRGEEAEVGAAKLASAQD